VDTQRDTFLHEALARAAEGWLVHPLYGIRNGVCECPMGRACGRTSGKHPRLKDWLAKATTDPRIIKEWWRCYPHSNIGGATGKRSGRNILDVDPRHDGHISLELLEAEYGSLPDTQEALTGGGGRHIHFRYTGPLSNTAGRLGSGLDIRSDGGNIVLPGSVHLSGSVYEYEVTHGPDDLPLADMPDWLLRLLSPQQRARVRLAPGRIPNGSVHYTFVSWAGSMHHRGMSAGAILAALLHENSTRCDPVRPEANIRKIVADITTRYEPGATPTPTTA
jgi:bifunctional DNA primase/polymerase-like protein